MTQIPPHQAIAVVNEAFLEWGLPQRIKIDNGWPFINPCHRDTPTLSIMWWIGLGIEVVQIDPGSPQQNGTVEGLQNICYRWVNPSKYDSVDSLQTALDQTGRIQRDIYKIPAKGYATRLELYPELLHNPRKGPLDAQFDFQRVEEYLARQVWQRNIQSGGFIKFMGQRIYIGYRMVRQLVTLTYDPLDHLWLIRSISGQLLKICDKQIITEEAIWKHAGMSKN